MQIACIDCKKYDTDSKSWTEALLSHGVTFLEPAMTELLRGETDPEEVIAYALSRGMQLNLHAPYGVNNIASTDRELRETSVGNVKYSIDLAAKYGLGVVAFHPGRLSEETEDPEKVWQIMLDAVAEIARYAEEKKVFVAIENMERRPYELVYTVEDLNRFAPIAENNPYFGVTVDFAHYASHGIGLPDLNALKLPLFDVHLSRIVDGKMHAPLSGGEGVPDVDAVCSLLADYGYTGTVVMEVREQVWESAEILKAALNKLI